MIWDSWSACGWVIVWVYIVIYFERRKKEMQMAELAYYQELLNRYDRVINTEIKYITVICKESNTIDYKGIQEHVKTSKVFNMIYDEIGIEGNAEIDYFNFRFTEQIKELVFF